MARIIGWVFCLAVIGLLEVPALRRQKRTYDLWVFLGLLAVVLVYGVLYFLDVPLFDPNWLVKRLFSPIGQKLLHSGT